MNKFLMATAALALGATSVFADVKIGMITTLSGGGAGSDQSKRVLPFAKCGPITFSGPGVPRKLL